MKRQKVVAICIAMLMAVGASTSVMASSPKTIDRETQYVNSIQPRYSYIDEADCTLDVYSDGTATVMGYVYFRAGTTCSITLKLKKNGSTIKTWKASSSKGHVELTKDVDNLGPGSYQAVLEFKCGSDEGTNKSTTEVI